jgi:transcriptional regulator of heat shock response
MIFIDSLPTISNNSLEVLEEVSNEISLQASKLQNRRLHLQELIAKRDRLDYEIKKLKKLIKEDKKATTRRGIPLKEEAEFILEQYSSDLIPVKDNPYSLHQIESLRQDLKAVEQEEILIDFLKKYSKERNWAE